MELLGHSSVTVSLDRYGHLLPPLNEALTGGLEGTYRAASADFSRTSAPGEVVEMPRSEAI